MCKLANRVMKINGLCEFWFECFNLWVEGINEDVCSFLSFLFFFLCFAGQHDGPLPRQHAGLLPESLIWAYIVQLSSALRTIHTAGLACRVMDPTKILITGKTRY